MHINTALRPFEKKFVTYRYVIGLVLVDFSTVGEHHIFEYFAMPHIVILNSDKTEQSLHHLKYSSATPVLYSIDRLSIYAGIGTSHHPVAAPPECG